LKLFGYEITIRNENISRSHPRDPAIAAIFGLNSSVSGINISESNALTIADVYKCVRAISQPTAMLPWRVFEVLERGKQLATAHPLYYLLYRRPNDNMSSFVFRETMMCHLLLWGNFYAYIERNGYSGKIIALWPLCPHAVKKVVKDRAVTFAVRNSQNVEEIFDQEEILHIPGLGYDGYRGYSPIDLHRESLGLSKATELYGAAFFGNNSRPDGYLSHPAKLKKDTIDRLEQSWEAKHRGVQNSHKIAVLEEGLKFESMSLSPEHAQYIETRKFQRSEIAGLFGVPPHKIGDLDKATFSNIEHQAREFIIDSVQPWLTRIEQECDHALLSERDQQKFYTKFEIKGYLRGDTAAQTQHIKDMFNIGVYSSNDAREFLDLNPIDGGDTYYVPLNMVPADKVQELFASKTDPQPNQKNEGLNRFLAAHRRVFRDAIGRIGQRAVAQRAKVAPAMIMPVLQTLAEFFSGKVEAETQGFLDDYASAFGKRSTEWAENAVDVVAEQEFDRAVAAIEGRTVAA
jgi:HK97 family phage portal protein